MKTSVRLLRLLSLLQQRRAWSGGQLAEELAVTTRTVRNDVDRLRELGYPVHASPGVAGGYRLGAGSDLPPLLLDDDEAVAVAIGLASAAAGAISGIAESSLRALVKLEQVMPARVQRRFRSLQQAVVTLPGAGPTVDARTLSVVATACRENQRLGFDYRGHRGDQTRRSTEPHRVVHDGRRWYLVAWDLDRSNWRTFRIDHMRPPLPAGPRFVPRPPPSDDLVAHVSRGLAQATWAYRARVKVHASAAELTRRVPAGIPIEAAGPDHCIASVGSDSADQLASHLGMLGADFEVLDPPEFRQHLRALGQRYLRAAGPARRSPARPRR